jgi:hypothetical protein
MNTLRTNFEKAGQFFEADQAKQRVTKLKDALSKKKLLTLTERHNTEVPSLLLHLISLSHIYSKAEREIGGGVPERDRHVQRILAAEN